MALNVLRRTENIVLEEDGMDGGRASGPSSRAQLGGVKDLGMVKRGHSH